jgi:hypothetical protein
MWGTRPSLAGTESRSLIFQLATASRLLGMTKGRATLPWKDVFHGAAIPDYSFRSATIGCTPAARRAGINDASSAARANSSVATVSITGSQGLTPNN